MIATPHLKQPIVTRWGIACFGWSALHVASEQALEILTRYIKRGTRGLTMKKLTFEIRSPAIQQNAIQTIQQLLPSYDKPMIVTVQERTRSLDQNRKLWSVLHDISSQVVWHGMKLESEDWKHIFTAALKGQRSAPGINGGCSAGPINQQNARRRVYRAYRANPCVWCRA